MPFITIEDQSPIMRRAKIRLVVAIVLLGIALGSLFTIGGNKSTSPNTRITSVAPSSPTPPPLQATEPEPEETAVQPPVAPPDPVYQSFTADPAHVAELPANESPPPLQEAPNAQGGNGMTTPKADIKTKTDAEKEAVRTSPTGLFILQVGVFSDMNNARKQLEKLVAHNMPAHTETRLWIGPFSNEQDANNAREAIQGSSLNISLQDGVISSAKGLMMASGVHTDMEPANTLRSGLIEISIPARTETRVLVGPFDTKGQAEKIRDRIKKHNISVVLMQTNGRKNAE